MKKSRCNQYATESYIEEGQKVTCDGDLAAIPLLIGSGLIMKDEWLDHR